MDTKYTSLIGRCLWWRPLENTVLFSLLDAMIQIAKHLVYEQHPAAPLPFPTEMLGQPLSDRCRDLVPEKHQENRRMESLAKRFHCLGFFDDDDHQPRAA